MDKELILAVAGSGKTSLIVSKLDLEQRFLVITYTINNTKNLKRSIIKKYGYFPDNVKLFSYYNFLYSFCLKPFLAYKIRPRGIFWEHTPNYTNRFKLDDPRRYMTKSRMLYHNRIAKLLEQRKVLGDINNRLTKYYNHLFIDEVQDFAGHDFNLIINILKSNINAILVGDFYQHTFDTSRDGRTNSSLHNDFNKYQQRFLEHKVKINKSHLNKSYRCTKNVCEFITENLGIKIESYWNNESVVAFINDKEHIMKIFKDNSIVKLFYRESDKYQCHSRNWGDCKGENHYNDICVVLNKISIDKYKKGELNKLKPVSKNKLYVACSRANNNLFLVDESEIKHLKK